MQNRTTAFLFIIPPRLLLDLGVLGGLAVNNPSDCAEWTRRNIVCGLEIAESFTTWMPTTCTCCESWPRRMSMST